ncbi:MAG: hypothetical protein ACYTGL_13990 [Planctomycetota bacterium]|jgi:hypothetical protein
MKIPETIDELRNDRIEFSWHALCRLQDRAGLRFEQNLDKVALAVVCDGVLVGGQFGGDVIVKSRCRGVDLAFVCCRIRDETKRRSFWLCRTVLTWDQAVANHQARIGA